MPKLQAGLKENRFYKYPILKQADEKNTPACFLYLIIFTIG